jgi:membrane protease YdiL (CAAX protease family)
MSAAVYFVIDKLMIVAAIASTVMWCRLLVTRRNREQSLLESTVPVRQRDQPFWTLADALILFGLHILLLTLGRSWLIQQGIFNGLKADEPSVVSSNPQLAAAGLTIVSALGACALTLAWLNWMTASPIKRLSLVLNARDARLGLKAAVLLLPPVLVISSLVNLFLPYSHEVLTMLQSVDSIEVFCAMFLATAIVTPFFEEFLFRVLIQGGLQGMMDGASDAEPGRWRPESYAPILITSVIFALLHFDNGAAPIPLFFLSLGLGYLYRQTGNITAPMVVHMCLNALTMIAGFTGPADP